MQAHLLLVDDDFVPRGYLNPAVIGRLLRCDRDVHLGLPNLLGVKKLANYA